MTRCGDIENKLSAYLDGDLPAGEKKLIEEHLSHCAYCSLTLSELEKTGDLLGKLEEVESPPWFTQKVMAQVREEVPLKKGLFKRLFYPFHIKIPIEVMAACMVAILAFSVYRTTGPEIKALQEPPAPSTTVPQQFAPKEHGGAPVATQKAAPELRTDLETSREKQKNETAAEKYPAEKSPVMKDDKFKEESKTGPSLGKSAPESIQGTAPSPAPLSKGTGSITPSQEAIPQGAAPAKKLRSVKEFPTAAPGRPNLFSVSLRAKDTEKALKETEDLLNHFGAQQVNIISHRDNLIILTADLPGNKIKEFLDVLKTIGNIKDNSLPPPSQEESIKVSIEITISQ